MPRFPSSCAADNKSVVFPAPKKPPTTTIQGRAIKHAPRAAVPHPARSGHFLQVVQPSDPLAASHDLQLPVRPLARLHVFLFRRIHRIGTAILLLIHETRFSSHRNFSRSSISPSRNLSPRGRQTH